MAVSQLKDGRWIVYYRKGTNPDDPGRSREYFPRGVEGEAAARKRNDDLGLGRYKRRTPKMPSPLFSELANAYLAAMVGNLEDSTLDNMMWKLNGIINLLPASPFAYLHRAPGMTSVHSFLKAPLCPQTLTQTVMVKIYPSFHACSQFQHASNHIGKASHRAHNS